MDFLELLSAILDLVKSWRFYVCAAVSALAGFGLDRLLANHGWRWIPILLALAVGIIVGALWHRDAGAKL